MTPQQITLTFWDPGQNEEVAKKVVAEYQKTHPNVTINYVHQSFINYRTRVQTQIRAGTGPDIFLIHNSWIPMFTTDLIPAPSSVFGFADYQTNFYPVLSDSFVKSNERSSSMNKILAVSNVVDGLALYINTDILSGVGLQPPKNWQEFMEDAVKMTVVDQNGTVKTAGAALGTTENIDYWSDILGLLLLQQPGVNLTTMPLNINNAATTEVLRFYTGFATDPKRKTWDASMPVSTQAFAQGRLAFYFGPAARATEIQTINPNLKFKIVPVPQLSGSNFSWATFWGYGVSASSKNPTQAWDFIKYVSSKEGEQFIFTSATQAKAPTQVYSRPELTQGLLNDQILGTFALQAPNYKFWYLSGNTFDNGLNDEMINVWQSGIDLILKGNDPAVILPTIQQGSQQILDKYIKGQVAPTK